LLEENKKLNELLSNFKLKSDFHDKEISMLNMIIEEKEQTTKIILKNFEEYKQMTKENLLNVEKLCSEFIEKGMIIY